MARRRQRPLPDVLTHDELQEFLQSPNRKCPTGQRNHVMLHIMADLGLRVSEVVSLELRDLDMKRGVLKVRMGKGRKDRILYLNPEDQSLMAAWLELRKEFAGGGPLEKVFVTLKGGPVSTRYVRYMVGRCARKAGIERRVYPHLLRHTFGTDLYRETKDLLKVRDAMGHSDIGTTQIYTRLGNHELEAALRGFRMGAGQ